MKRREFITIAGGAAAWPVGAFGQQSTIPVVGLLDFDPKTGARSAFAEGLAETGYFEGRNVAIEYRSADGRMDRFPVLAAELVRGNVSVIATVGATPAALAAKAATSTIPIVFQIGTDPVQRGLVASLNRPGANVTGVTSLNTELGPKRLEMLHELIPSASAMALLVNPADPISVETDLQNARNAALALGVQLHVLQARAESEFEPAFVLLREMRVGGLVISASPLFGRGSQLLASLAVRFGVPTVSPYPDFVAAGGSLSYGGNLRGQFRQTGVQTGQILKGAKPADLPVDQVTLVELIVNLKSIKSLGLSVPLTLLGRADRVIE